MYRMYYVQYRVYMGCTTRRVVWRVSSAKAKAKDSRAKPSAMYDTPVADVYLNRECTI